MSLSTNDKQYIKETIREGIADRTTKEMMRAIVREETLDMREDIGDIREELTKQGILAEEARVEVRQMLGMLSDNLKVRIKVDDHEARISTLEKVEPMLSSTVRLHSKQLKALRGTSS